MFVLDHHGNGRFFIKFFVILNLCDLLNLKQTNNFSDILSKFFWNSQLMLKVFLPCKFSTEIAEASSELMFAVYSCDWYEIRIKDKKFVKSMFILMENVKRETIISFGWMPMTLMTFTSILNSGYSLFSFMRSLQE